MTTVIVESDIHAGSVFGVVANPAGVREEYRYFAQTLFDWREKKIREIGSVDMVIELGEVCDGPGHASSLEVYTTDMDAQADDAADLICMWPSDDIRICHASKYHSGKDGKIEYAVSDKIKLRGNRRVEVKDTHRLQIEGVKVNARHHVGNSRTGHGQFSQLGKVATNDYLRGAYREYPGADLYLRAHTHKYAFVGDELYAAYNNPAMQWPLGEYGFKIDDPHYTMGFLKLTIDGSSWNVEPYLLRVSLPEETYAKVTKGR